MHCRRPEGRRKEGKKEKALLQRTATWTDADDMDENVMMEGKSSMRIDENAVVVRGNDGVVGPVLSSVDAADEAWEKFRRANDEAKIALNPPHSSGRKRKYSSRSHAANIENDLEIALSVSKEEHREKLGAIIVEREHARSQSAVSAAKLADAEATIAALRRDLREKELQFLERAAWCGRESAGPAL